MEVTIFKPKIQAILKTADLETVSARRVRLQLEQELGLDLKEHKKEVDALIKKCFLEFTEESQQDAKPPKVESPETHIETTTSTPQTKKQKVKHEVKEEEERHDEITDDADARYARELQAQYNSPRASRSARADGAKAPAKRKRVTKRKTETIVNSDGETVEVEVKRKVAKNGFNKLLTLSDELAALLKVQYLSRPQVSKQIWAYIKSPENNLQDQVDKRYINCDATLEALLGTPRVHMFTMTKLLQKHMRDDGTAPAGYGDGGDLKEESKETVDSDDDDEVQTIKKRENSSSEDAD